MDENDGASLRNLRNGVQVVYISSILSCKKKSATLDAHANDVHQLLYDRI